MQGRYLPNSKWAPCDPDEEALAEDAQRSQVNNVAGAACVPQIVLMLLQDVSAHGHTPHMQSDACCDMQCAMNATRRFAGIQNLTAHICIAGWAPGEPQQWLATTHQSQPFTSLRTLQLHASTGVPRKDRCLVNVLRFLPSEVQDLCHTRAELGLPHTGAALLLCSA